ncbi:sperm microtubule inner protein 6 isoform X2 [Erinaceus europaeus]|uniref:Sperm microtubule inner protein 6 isoform X2 n=1 Tax=Erinaceus europaeus TaxID=9365 RepID=A0ABM3Y2F4_ERIEU|nr:sperm microtubule inner protein 6 isoform X2 [Erinaceus europaeus]
MFLFSRKTKTPVSTYTDSYRAPTSIKEVYKDPPLYAWEANKFVTPGLTHTMRRQVDPEALQKMLRCAVEDYTYKSCIPAHPYLPEKYWISQMEDRCYPYGDRCNILRMEPYYCSGWNNRYTTCLPQLPKDAGMETVVRGMPLECPPKPEQLNSYERSVVANMLNTLTRYQTLPQITPRCGCVDALPRRLPFQGYQSACSGRHYCLRGMDYYLTGEPCTQRSLRPLCSQLPTVRSVPPCEHRPGMQCAVITPPPSYCPCPNLRWDTSHFKKTGGPQRNNYVVHPEFVSESYPKYYF